jgi:hypothetical protein
MGNRPGRSSNLLCGSLKSSGFSLKNGVFRQENHYVLSKTHEQTILEISQGDYINIIADSFLIDRQARELSRPTLRFYRDFLRTFIEYCNANSLTFIQEITADFL